jgi:hypothetical protein
LIIGRSGTGKSSLLKKLLDNFPKNRFVYLINVKGAEIAEYSRGRPGEKIKIVKKLSSGGENFQKDSFIILEDLIKLNSKEADSVRQLLNYTAHHKRCKVFCVTHTIYKTGIYSLLPLFHYIVFTSSPSNVPIARSVLGTFKIDKPVLGRWILFIKNGLYDKEGNYFFFDCTKMVFGTSTNFLQRGQNKVLGSLTAGNSEPAAAAGWDNFWQPNFGGGGNELTQTELDVNERLARMRALFCDYFSLHPKKQQACALFFTVSSGLGAGRINEHDLSVSFSLRNKIERTKKISLVDYVSSLLDSSNSRPTTDLKVMHNYVKKKCSLPQSAVTNVHYKG